MEQKPLTPEHSTAARDAAGLFPWRFIARTLTSAFRLRVLLLAMVGVTVGSLISDNGAVFEGTRVARWDQSAMGILQTPLLHWRRLTQGVVGSWIEPGGSVLGVLRAASLVVWWALIGGAIARIAVADLTHRPPAAMFAAMAASARQLPTRCLPLLAVGLASTVLMVPLWLHGLVMHAPLLGVLSALLLPIPLTLAAVAVVLLVLLAVNWLILMACPAVEQTDAFDATSRAFAYVTQRPVRLFGYVLTAVFVTLPITLVVSEAGRLLTWMAVEGLPAVADEPTAADRVAVFWVTTLVARLPDIVVAAYTWCAAVAIYLLLRRDVDGVQVDELDGRA